MVSVALFAVCTALSVIAALFAIGCYFVLRAETRKRGTNSLRAELDELNDAFEKHRVLLKRINQRGVMAERRLEAADDGSPSSNSQRRNETGAQWKERMRRELALGRVSHRE